MLLSNADRTICGIRERPPRGDTPFAGGVDKDKATHDAANPLHIAAGKGRLHVARLLQEANAEKDKAHQSGATLMSQLRRGSWRLCGFCWKRMRTRTRPRVMAPPLSCSQLQKGIWRLCAFCWRPMPTRTRPTGVAPTLCIRRGSEWLVGGCAAFADSQCGQGHFRVAPPLCMSRYERTVGDCAAVAAGQCREGQGSSQWHHPCVHRSSEWTVGSCVAFCWLPMRTRTRPTGVAKPRRESQLRMAIWRSPRFLQEPNMDKIKAVNDGAD